GRRLLGGCPRPPTCSASIWAFDLFGRLRPPATSHERKARSAEPAVQSVEQQIDHRRRVEREHLRDQQSANDGDTERAPKLGAGAYGDHQRQCTEHGGHRGHQDRAETGEAGVVNRPFRRETEPPFAVEREVHHHDAVLLHDADEENNADEGNDREFRAKQLQRKQRTETGRRQRGNDGQRVGKTLIESAEHDVDSDQPCDQQKRLCAGGLFEGPDVAGKIGVDDVGQMEIDDGFFDSRGGILDRGIGCQVVRDGYRGELTLVIDCERNIAALDARYGRQRNLRGAVARNVDAGEIARVALVLAAHFQNDAVLVAGAVNCRDLPLRKGVVERVVDILDTHTQPRRGLSVDADIDLQPSLVTVSRDVDDARYLLYAVENARYALLQFLDVRAPQRELVLRIGLPAAHPNVLGRKHKNAETGNLGELRPYPGDDALGAQSTALVERLQADKQAAEIDRGVEIRGADRRAEACDSRVGEHHIHRLELQGLHGVERNIR